MLKLSCPTCRETSEYDITIQGADVAGFFSSLIEVDCPWCESTISAPSQGDGVYSTTPAGGLSFIAAAAEFVETSDDGTLAAFRDRLQEAGREGDEARLKAELASVGIHLPAAGATAQLVLNVVTVLITVATLVLSQRAAGEAPTKDQIDQLIRIEKQRSSDPRATPHPREPQLQNRNERCGCGSGRKFKQCHGAPPTSAAHPRNRPLP